MQLTTSPGEKNFNSLQLTTVFKTQLQPGFLINLCLIWGLGGCPKSGLTWYLLKHIFHTIYLRSFSPSSFVSLKLLHETFSSKHVCLFKCFGICLKQYIWVCETVSSSLFSAGCDYLEDCFPFQRG